MLVVTLVLLVAGAVLLGIVVADWPHYRGVLALTPLQDGGDALRGLRGP